MTKKQYEKLRVGDKVRYTGKGENDFLITNKIYTVRRMLGLIYVEEHPIGGDFYQRFEYIPPNSIKLIKEL